MSKIKISMSQINTTVGSLDSNTKKIIDKITKAKKEKSNVICFPELSITGYPPEDLVLSDLFIKNNIQALNSIKKHTKNIIAIVGFIDKDINGIYNSAAILNNGKIIEIYRKTKLPNYGVFDEKRYFHPGSKVVVIQNNDIKIGISICEDIWDDYEICKLQSNYGCNLLININGSPYDINKKQSRIKHLSSVSKNCNAHLVYLNLVGGQDELIFDGSSLVFNNSGNVIYSLPSFEEKDGIIDLDINFNEPNKPLSNSPQKYNLSVKDIDFQYIHTKERNKDHAITKTNEIEDVYKALILGTRDYLLKNKFNKCLVSLSGGIDSAVVTAIAAKAIGSKNIVTVNLPSRYSSDHSITDSEKLCKNLGINLINLPIEDSHKSMEDSLNFIFKNTKKNVAEENLQARIRGNIIMTISNKFSLLVLSTGNKSEIATGYATLYGDMAGGFSVLKDVPKTMVYKLANYINKVSDNYTIPLNIINKPPSAELKPDQIDQDKLPKYEILDKIIELYVEKKQNIKEIMDNKILRKKISNDEILDIIQMIDRNEYKRRQSAPGVKITPLAFGKDRRYPIASELKYTYTNFIHYDK